MTNWLDHAHDARDTLAVLPALPSDDPRIPNLLAEAQVHATLALVEQQRIANLITVAGWVLDSTPEDIGYEFDKLRHGLAGEVWATLGLGDAS